MATDDDLGLDSDFDPMETAPMTKVPVSDGATKKSDNRKKADRGIPDDVHGVARDQLRAFCERIERLEEEKKTIADDVKDVYAEAKASGFDTKILKKVIALRKKDEQERMEEEAILETYLLALGMI